MERFEGRIQIPSGLYRQCPSLLPRAEMHTHCSGKSEGETSLRRSDGIRCSRPAYRAQGLLPKASPGRVKWLPHSPGQTRSNRRADQ